MEESKLINHKEHEEHKGRETRQRRFLRLLLSLRANSDSQFCLLCDLCALCGKNFFSYLRALRVLRGENIFTANPEDPNILMVTADADLAADDVSDQSDDDDNERCQKGDHGAALELPAEGIIERQ